MTFSFCYKAYLGKARNVAEPFTLERAVTQFYEFFPSALSLHIFLIATNFNIVQIHFLYEEKIIVLWALILDNDHFYGMLLASGMIEYQK